MAKFVRIKGKEVAAPFGGFDGFGEIDSTVGHYIRTNVRKFPNKEAIVDCPTGETKTFAEFYNESCKVANALLDLGLEKGDHIAWNSGDRIWSAELYLGPALAGISQTPINYRFTADEIVRQINHSNPKVIIYQDEFAEAINAARPKMPSVKHYIMITSDKNKEAPEGSLNYWDWKEKASENDPEERVGRILPDDLFGIFYTAGTTGFPKGVMHSHKTYLSWSLNAILGWYRLSFDSRMMYLMPLFHWGGFVVFGVVLIGGTWLISPYAPEYPWKWAEKYKPDAFLLTSAMWTMSLGVPDWKNKYDVSSVKTIGAGAAPLPVTAYKAAVEAFPDCNFVDLYSSTESQFSYTSKKWKEILPQNVGFAPWGKELSIRDAADRSKECKPDEVGVVYARGPGQHCGYYNNDDENEKTFLTGGWQTSEDTGYIDSETGTLVLFDRVKDVICSGAENVSSVEVEGVLLQHPAVMECAVIGIPDPVLDQKIAAMVTLNPGMTAEPNEIEEFCKGKMAGFKRPRVITILPELPHNAVGKVLKTDLREPFWKDYDSRITAQ